MNGEDDQAKESEIAIEDQRNKVEEDIVTEIEENSSIEDSKYSESKEESKKDKEKSSEEPPIISLIKERTP